MIRDRDLSAAPDLRHPGRSALRGVRSIGERRAHIASPRMGAAGKSIARIAWGVLACTVATSSGATDINTSNLTIDGIGSGGTFQGVPFFTEILPGDIAQFRFAGDLNVVVRGR